VHCWADLLSVHGFRCYDNIMPNAKCWRVLVLAVCLVLNLVTLLMNVCCNIAQCVILLGRLSQHENILTREFVVLTGEPLQLSSANVTSGYNESSTLTECSTPGVSFTMDRKCSSSNLKVLSASKPAVDSVSGSVNEANPMNFAGVVKDVGNVATSSAISLSSQMSDAASLNVSMPDTGQHQTKTAAAGCSSTSSCAHSVSCSQCSLSVHTGQPRVEVGHCSSHQVLPNQTVLFKVVF